MERIGYTMKKLIALFLVALMIPCVAVAESTNTRGLVEFLELYSSRFAAYACQNGLEFDASTYSDLPPYKSGDYLVFESSAGSIAVYPASYAIHDVTMTFYSMTDDDADNELFATSCIMAISALEFDASYEKGPSLAKKSATDDAVRIFDEEIGGRLEESLTQAIETGKRVYVCSCNYDYYIDYFVSGAHEFVYLIAEERK